MESMYAKRKEGKGNTETNLDTRQWEKEDWRKGPEKTESSNKFLKSVQKDAQTNVKPDNKQII